MVFLLVVSSAGLCKYIPKGIMKGAQVSWQEGPCVGHNSGTHGRILGLLCPPC